MAKSGVSDIIEKVSPNYCKKGPVWEHELVYDSSSETLEPLYFWILDFMNAKFDVEKLVDSFTSSPGGGHFSELAGKATQMQQRGMEVMQTVGIMIKSLVNIIYDLRNFEIRFNDYDAAKSKDKDKAEAGLIALKQIWMDKVDIARGNTSIKALTFSQTAFATLIDAFMVAKSEKDVKEIDLNDRVKRILIQRIHEFNKWRELSEKELRKRYEIQRAWLKSQVNSLKLYARWAKPYFVAAEKLRMKESGRSPELVNIFNTLMLELTLLGKKKIDVEEAAVNRDIPEEFRKLKLKRNYYSCVLMDFVFRGIPQRIPAQQAHYVFGGRVEVTFRGYCLNEDELKMIDEKLGESGIEDALSLVGDATEESLTQLREDIEYFLKDEKERELEQKEKEESEDVNPFSALLGLEKRKPRAKGKEKQEGKEKARLDMIREKGVGRDSYAESVIRKYGERVASAACFKVFDTYKKAHGMPSHPDPFD